MGGWFRGEAVGVAPIPAGKTADHDLGDGFYLTDNKDSAIQYSELRTADPAAWRVYSVQIDESSLRTLDLTTDPRWAKDLRMVEPSIKAANVNYGRVFVNFIKANRIDLSQYDAVVGVDYMRGGRQMCILFKNGQPSRLQNTIRSNFTPEPIVGPALDSASAARRLPRGYSDFGEGAMVVGFGLVDLGLSILAVKVREWSDGQFLKWQLEGIQPAIETGIRKHAAAIADLQLKGRKAFANITIEIWVLTDYSAGAGIASLPVVHLKGVFVSANNVNLDQGKRNEGHFASQSTFYQYAYSVEVSVSANERVLYNALMLEYQFFDRQATLDPRNLAWTTGREAAKKAIISAFGREAAYDLLETWPKWTYKGTPMKK